MTSISSVNGPSAALFLQKSQSQSPSASPPQTTVSSSIGSTSAAKVPSSIAAMSLRGAQTETALDQKIGGSHQVSDGDADDR
ncbi:hypothetical protein [Rhizobium rhizogenes]|uniref:hypothetical protein n=1 Tax=Rhizobium rhizogenes TaxID=359 RepID=UPI0012D2EDA4|nr:hypothetical protein [Rhizobium rhizogenes]